MYVNNFLHSAKNYLRVSRAILESVEVNRVIVNKIFCRLFKPTRKIL